MLHEPRHQNELNLAKHM